MAAVDGTTLIFWVIQTQGIWTISLYFTIQYSLYFKKGSIKFNN